MFAVITKACRPTGIGSGIGCSIGDTDTTGIGSIPIPSTGIGLSLSEIHMREADSGRELTSLSYMLETSLQHG